MENEMKEIRERLITLETRSEEQWKSHDINSTIKFGVVNDKLDLLLKDKDYQDTRKEGCMREAKKYANSCVKWALGIPATISSILGVIWVIVRLTDK